MIIDFNTLELLQKYVVSFMADMQNLSAMGVQMYGKTVMKDTDFGKLLHKEGLWSLYAFEEEKSLLYHLCRNKYGRFELNNNPCHPGNSTCIECDKEAPEEIKGLWTLHNFEWIQKNGGTHV